MDKKILNVESRTLKGRKVNKLRREGIIPANIFGKKIKSKAISVKLVDFKNIFKEVGETGLIDIKIKSDDKKEDRAVLVSNVQMDPVSDIPVHVDFHQVDLKEKVSAEVPVELTGVSPAEKQSIGTVVLYINEVEVEALPGDLPEKFIIDISKLEEVDQAVYVKDLDIDKSKIEIKAELEEIIVKVEPPQKEEVVEPVVTETEAEGETVAEAVADGKVKEESPAEEGEAKEVESKPQKEEN
ncbi:MAG: 50S ribosomal protein L25 [Patescibacteria group bacterium]